MHAQYVHITGCIYVNMEGGRVVTLGLEYPEELSAPAKPSLDLIDDTQTTSSVDVTAGRTETRGESTM